MDLPFLQLLRYYVIMFLWIPYYAACDAILGVGWEYPVRPVMMMVITLSFFACCLIPIVLRPLLFPAHRLVQSREIGACVAGLKGRFYVAFVGGSVVVSLAALLAMKGVALDVGNYGSRFESNVGTGMYSVLSFSVVSLFIAILHRYPNGRTLIGLLVAAVLYGVLLFLVLGGARNYLVAAVAPVLLVAYRLRIVNLLLLGSIAICGVLLITVLASVRYGDSLGMGSFELLAVYARDTVFPVGSLAGILDSIIPFVGFEYFFNQFYAVIPRALWEGKPIYLDTIAYYYTEGMLGYGKGLVIAPTGIGSLYIMGGRTFVLFGPVVIVLFMTFLDYLALRRSAMWYVCALPAVFFTFFCFRESVELGVYKILIHTIFAAVVFLASRVAYKLLTNRRISARPTRGRVNLPIP